jgi:hypothetical protein
VEGVKFARLNRVVWAASVAYFVIVLATSSSWACTYSYDPKEVARGFFVEITDHGKGIADLHVQVHESGVSSENSKLALDAITDDHGIASFHLAHPGAFRISIKDIELTPDEEITLNKTPSKSALVKIVIELPQGVLSVRSISGSIHGQVRTDNLANYGESPLIDLSPAVKLTLIRARSEKIVESHVANESGSFSFSALPGGLYLLHVEAPADPVTHGRAVDGYIPIAIDPFAKVSSLDLHTSPGTCVPFAYWNGDGPSST